MKKSMWVNGRKRNLWTVFLFIAAFSFGAFAADYNITVNADTNEGWVPYTMFGANFVINKNDFDSNWKSVFESCGMKAIRYPGGTMTERAVGTAPQFDYLTNAPYMTDILLYCKTNTAVKLVFVVPTYRFTNDVAAGAAYASNFVKYVNTTLKNELCTPKVMQWEIGNEYYGWVDGDDNAVAASNYARVAAAEAAAILQVDSNLTTIVHYFRNEPSQTQIIADYLNGTPSIKACSTHIYPGENQDVLATVPSQLLDAADRLGFPLTDYVTEWNVANESAVYPSGLAVADRHLTIFKSLVLAGVNYATMWPLMWHPNTIDHALADWNGSIRPQGQAYQWLQQSAKGTWMVECTDDNTTPDSAAFKYLGTQRLSILISGKDLPTNSSVCVTVNGFVFNPSTGVFAQRVYASSGDVYTNAPATIAVLSPSVFGSATNKLSFTINKNSQYEIVKIDLTP